MAEEELKTEEVEGTNEKAEEISGEDEEGDEERDMEGQGTGALFSPEGIIMLIVAGLLDTAGIVFTILDLALGIGEIFSWISDGIGIIFFGIWRLFGKIMEEETTSMAITENVAEKRRGIKQMTTAIKKAAKVGKGTRRFIVAILGELIVVIGALPFWTWFVYSELKNK